MNGKIICIFLFLIGLSSCLEPYEVNIKDYKDLLVVDALITDEVKNHRVHLSRSVPNLDETPQVEAGALVIIKDENHNEEVLTEVAPGVYETDQKQFIAKVGGTYTLSIRTANGQEYQSSPCNILPKSTLNKVYVKTSKKWNEDRTIENYGLTILVDGNSYENGYMRWEYEEDWKFKVPYAPIIRYDYDAQSWVRIIKPENEICWKSSISNEVIIHSLANQGNFEVKAKEICFIPSGLTDKLSVRYSILIKQMSISKGEYEFWNKLKISLEDTDNIAGNQPFSIKGNIKNINDSKEPVLGYFQTGSVSFQRLYIDRNEVVSLGLPMTPSNYGCLLNTFIADGKDYDTPLEIYEDLVVSGKLHLHDVVNDESGMRVIGLMLTSATCSDCTYSGTLRKPDFWED